MPRLMGNDMENATVGGGFGYSGVRIDSLGATEYTLALVACDISGSVSGYAAELLAAVQNSMRACQKSPRSVNILARQIRFNTGVQETHGFVPVPDLDVDGMPAMSCGGGTALFDAAYSGIAGINDYADKLTAQDFLVNGIAVVITDGEDNASKTTPAMIKAEIEKATKGEHLESMITILVGVTGGSAGMSAYLTRFKNEAGFDHYLDIKDADPSSLAKLGEFISKSISSTSQALGTGGASQNISMVI